MKNETFWLLVVLGLLLFSKSKRRRMTPRQTAKTPDTETPEKITPAPPSKIPEDGSGWAQWRELLAQKESGGRYDARRPGSQYWGRYQLGTLARSNTSAKGVRWSKFKSDIGLQNRAVKEWTARAYNELQAQPDARAAVAAKKATWAQLVAMDHLTGRAATMKWIRTGQITKDANDVSNLDWGKDFARFDLSELKRGSG